jgi:hypothetical protein
VIIDLFFGYGYEVGMRQTSIFFFLIGLRIIADLVSGKGYVVGGLYY